MAFTDQGEHRQSKKKLEKRKHTTPFLAQTRTHVFTILVKDQQYLLNSNAYIYTRKKVNNVHVYVNFVDESDQNRKWLTADYADNANSLFANAFSFKSGKIHFPSFSIFCMRSLPSVCIHILCCILSATGVTELI